MSRRILSILTLGLLLPACSDDPVAPLPSALTPSFAFVDAFAEANWTFFADGGDGSVIFGGTSTLTLTGNNTPGQTTNTDVYVTVPAAGTITFDWSYSSGDEAGYDGAYYMLNAAYWALANCSGWPCASGSITLPVAMGDVFKFRIYSMDGLGGPGVLAVTNFNFAPEGLGFASTCTYRVLPAARKTEVQVFVTWMNADPGVTKIAVTNGTATQQKVVGPLSAGEWTAKLPDGLPTYSMNGGISRNDQGTVLVPAGTACTAM